MMGNNGINLEKYLAWICGIGLFVLCPLVYPKLGEQQYSYIQLCLFSFILYCYNCYFLIRKRKEFAFRFADLTFFIGCSIYLIHVCWIVPVNLTIWAWLRFLIGVGIYLFVRLQSLDRIKFFFVLFVISGCIQCVYAAMQKMHLLPSLNNAFDMTGSFLNPAPLAGYLAVILCMLVAKLVLNPFYSNKSVIGLIFPILLMSLTIFLLKSRAAYWSCFVVMSVLLYKKIFAKARICYRFIGLILGGIFLFLLLIFLYKQRIVSANGRLFIWENTINMIKEHPISGVGIGNFKSTFPVYQAAYYKKKVELVEKYYDGNTFFAFNEFLEQYAEMGVCFLILMLLLFVTWYKSHISKTFQIYLYGIGSFIVFSFFSYPFSVFTLFVLFIFFMSFIGHCTPIIHICKYYHVISCGTIAISFIVFGLLGKGLNAVIKWKTLQNEQNLSQRINFYPKYHWCFQDNISFTLHYYSMTRDYKKTDEELHVLNTAIQRIPLAGWYLLRGNYYMEVQEWDRAEQDFTFLLYLVPTQLEPIYKLAQLYSLTHKEKEAVLLLEEAFASKRFQMNLTNKMIISDMKKLYKTLVTLNNQ